MTKPDYVEALEFALGVEAEWAHDHHYMNFEPQNTRDKAPSSAKLCSGCDLGIWLVSGKPVRFETHRDKAEVMLRLMEAMRIAVSPLMYLPWSDDWVAFPGGTHDVPSAEMPTAPEAVLKAVLALKESE